MMIASQMLVDNVSFEIEEKLKIYLNLLKKWQEKINLVSPQTISDVWNRHFIDSMQISKLIPDNANIIFDFGSGAGFPGLVLAIMNPDKDFYMIESDQKKCAFMNTVSRETAINNAHVNNSRIEAVSRETIPDVIMARALTSLDGLLNYSKDWVSLNQNLKFVFPKGEKYLKEVDEAHKNWKFDVKEIQSKTSNNATILLLSNVVSI